MQGRLTPPQGRGIQFFPFDNWENEFRLARAIGINEIDFIFDLERFEDNPLWNSPGVQKIKALIAETGVVVNYTCADFFMRRPFFRESEGVRQDNIKILKQLISAANDINAKGIEIPLLDNSSIKTDEEEKILIESLKECLSHARANHITLNLEIDYPPKKLLALISKFNHPQIKITYDSGNSSSLGFDPYEEITTYGQFVTNVHLKDRVLGGTTVPLGTGNANFDKLFKALEEVSYNGNYILQAARGEEGKEAETLKNYIEFLKNYVTS